MSRIAGLLVTWELDPPYSTGTLKEPAAQSNLPKLCMRPRPWTLSYTPTPSNCYIFYKKWSKQNDMPFIIEHHCKLYRQMYIVASYQ